MAYTYTDGVNPAKPAGSDTANVDDDIRAMKNAYNERLAGTFGGNWATDDPIAPTKVGTAIAISAAQATTATANNATLGATPTIDWATGNIQRGTLTANATFTLSNPVAWTTYYLVLTQNGTGGWSVTLPATVRWTNNSSAPTLVTTASRTTVITLLYTGSVYLASLAGTGYNVS